IEVMSGEMLEQRALDSSSKATPAILSGKVVVGAERSLNVFSSPGILTGKINDVDGAPLEGFARLVGTDETVTADENGRFNLSVMPGEYDVRVSMYGYEQVEETLTFQSGYTIEKEYNLDKVEEGTLVGEVVDARSNEVIEDVKVNVLDSPLETTIDNNGTFSFDAIYEGNYDLVLETGGYVTETVTATVSADETVEIAVEMDPIDVAVLNDYEETITTLLNRNNIPAEEREWDDILSDMDKYQVVYLNGAYKSGGWQPDQEDVN